MIIYILASSALYLAVLKTPQQAERIKKFILSMGLLFVVLTPIGLVAINLLREGEKSWWFVGASPVIIGIVFALSYIEVALIGKLKLNK